MTTSCTGVPAESATLVGRDADVRDIHRLVGRARLVTLIGPGGVGKTRLAYRVAAQRGPSYSDGVGVTELGTLTEPDRVGQVVAGALGLPECRDPVDAIVERVAGRRLLLVLDNCEHLLDAVAQFVVRLLAACPRLRILATSREPLAVPGEAVYRVAPLAVPPPGATGVAEIGRADSVRLFRQRAAEAGSPLNLTPELAPLVARLCNRLDGIPLALELAAGRLRGMAVAEIAAGLDDRFALLVNGNRTLSRQHTLRAAVDWSHDLLGTEERMVLRRIAAFPASCTAAAAESVCDLPGVRTVLGRLVDRSLVHAEQVGGVTRYAPLETIRAYGLERLAEAEEAGAARDRLLDWAVAFATEQHALAMVTDVPWARRVQALLDTGAERDNLGAALSWSVYSGRAEEGLRIVSAMRWFWVAKGYFVEARDWIAKLLPSAGPDCPASLVADAMRTDGEMAYELGEYADARLRADKALAAYREIGDQAGEAGVLNLLGALAIRADELDRAREQYEEALVVARSARTAWEEAAALGGLGSVHFRAGELRLANDRYAEAATAWRALHNCWAKAGISNALGAVAAARGDRVAARTHFTLAEKTMRPIGADPQVARALAGQARLAIEEGDLDEAGALLGESLTLCRRTGQRLDTARTLEMLANLATARDDVSRAVRLSAAAHGLRSASGLPTRRPPATAVGLARERLGDLATDRLWASGLELDLASAAELATQPPRPGAEPSAPAPRPASRVPDPLTPREYEVAQLVERGLTNRQIAAELYLSPATAARHIANILGKLGFRNRAQIAGWLAGRPGYTSG